MKSPFYKTGNSKSPLFNHHTVKARKSKTQGKSDKDKYDKHAYQLNLKATDTMFGSTNPEISNMKSQMYKIKGKEKFEPKKKQILDNESGITTYYTIVPKN